MSESCICFCLLNALSEGPAANVIGDVLLKDTTHVFKGSVEMGAQGLTEACRLNESQFVALEIGGAVQVGEREKFTRLCRCIL